jgi:uncharacterized membrane protein YraQ (UPF0718 family)
MTQGYANTTAATTAGEESRVGRAAAAIALAIALSGLFYYKWGASLRAYDRVRVTSRLAVDPAILVRGGPLAGTLAYFGKIWPALVFGIVIGAVVRAALPSSWIARTLGARGVRGSLAGAAVGAPLMLCSCCVTPVFTGLYERGARLGLSLAVMLGAPGLNIAALALTFALLPTKIALARAAAALVLVIGVTTLLGSVDVGPRAKAASAVAPEPTTALDFGWRLLASLAYLIVVTVPLVVVGVLGGALLLPYVGHLTAIGAVFGIAGVALVSVLVALPTFFEIPLALLLLQAGAPAGAAVALLIAGPIVNLPSLLVVGRETHPRVAAALALAVFTVATSAGVLVS